MKKIIHISDLLVGYKYCLDNLSIIIDTLIRLIVPGNNYVIVITGNLVSSGDIGLFRTVKAQLQILTDAGFDVLIVPGNHDYGYHGIKRYAELVPVFKQVFFNDTEIIYPKLDIIENVAFIGLDSMEEELKLNGHFSSQGELGEAQLDRLRDILDSPMVAACQKRVVYLHHHPFNPQFDIELKDANELRKVVQNRIDALLFGHNKNDRNYYGYWGIPRCSEGGSATSKENTPTSIRVIDLEQDPSTDLSWI